MNENHKRVMEVYLYNVECFLEQIRREARANEMVSDQVLISSSYDIDERTRDNLLQGITSMLNEIRSIKQQYGLKPQSESSKRRIEAALTEIWITINDLRPGSLENYGPLEVEEKEEVDSMVARLLRTLEKMGCSAR